MISTGYHRMRIFKFFPVNQHLINFITKRRISMSLPKLNILYEDEHLIAINKPNGMLSVPCKEALSLSGVQPRLLQWEAAIKGLMESNLAENPYYKNIIEILIKNIATIPRKKDRFCRYLQRLTKVNKESEQLLIWDKAVEIDRNLHSVDLNISSIPTHLLSASDLVEVHCQQKIYHVHRLDMETSGILIFAKTEDSASCIGQQFQERQVSKQYLARVHGFLPSDENGNGEISLPMKSDPNRKLMSVIDLKQGKPSLTKYSILHSSQKILKKRFIGEVEEEKDGFSSGWEGFFPEDKIMVKDVEFNEKIDFKTSLILLKPLTGRTHQLRVHMAAMGCPILGDPLYSHKEHNYLLEPNPEDTSSILLREGAENFSFYYPRLCLHAWKLKLFHPESGYPLELTAATE